MASSPPLKWQRGESDKTSRIFCCHANFPEMNGGISVYRGTKSNNHKERRGAGGGGGGGF